MKIQFSFYAMLTVLIFVLCGPELCPNVQAALGENRLLILAPAEFEDGMQPLVDVKQATGFDVTLLTLEDIHDFWSPGDTGDVTPGEVKRTIRLLDSAYGIGYVMLVGDVNKFPVRWQLGHLVDYQVEGITNPTVAFDQVFLPTDFYYADLYDSTGAYNDWDADGDGYYGEIYASNLNPDAMDFTPDVAIGRVPAADLTQLETYVAKVIRYEFNNSSHWFDRALLIQKGWSGAIFSKENIADHLEDYFFDIRRLYEDIAASDYSGSTDGDPTSRNISSWINVGAGFISHLYHGQPDEWELMYDIGNIRTDLIRENRLSVIYSNGCDTAQFFCNAVPYCDYEDVSGVIQPALAHGANGDTPPAEPSPFQQGGLNHLSIGEAFLVENDFGAVAYFGSMNTGEVDKGFFAHEYLEQAFFTSWTPDDNVIGDMWADAIITFATLNNLSSLTPGGWGETCMVHTPSRFILLGDPTLRVGGVEDLLDRVPPTVTNDYDGSWHNENVWVTLTATDEGSAPLHIPSGIERFSYTINGSGVAFTSNPVFIGAPSGHTNDGIHRIESRAVDFCRNSSMPMVTEVKIDTVAPVTDIRLDGTYPATVACPSDSGSGFTCPERGCYDKEVLVTLTATDDESYTSDISGVSGTGYNYDRWPFEAYSAPFTVSGSCGTHVNHLDYFSKDNADNREDMQRESFCITSDNCLMDMGVMRERARILAAMEEIIALRMRDDFASTLPPIESVSYEYALEGQELKWILISEDIDGKNGWGVEWDTTGVQNGNYRVRLTVRGSGKILFQEELKTLVSNLSKNSYLFQHTGPTETGDGDLVNYSIVFENRGNTSIYNAEVICDLEPGNFDQLSLADNGYLDKFGRPAWSRTIIDPGEKWTMKFSARIKAGLTPGTVITSQASLSAINLPMLISDDPSSKEAGDYTSVRIKDKNGTISGIVQQYKYGTPVQADIVLTGNAVAQTTSNTQGYFSFTDVQPGSYTVAVSAGGYAYHVPAGPQTIVVNNQGDSYQANFLMIRQDARAPRSQFSFSADEIVQQGMTILSGTASDYVPGSGIEKVEISIKRNTDGSYWNGSVWSSATTWLTTTGAEKWSRNCGPLIWNSALSYTLKSRAIDKAGNVEQSSGQSTTPNAPKPLFPTDKTKIYNLKPPFDWEDEPESRYILQVDNNADFLTPEIHQPYYIEVSHYVPAVPLIPGTYYWRVQAVSNDLAPAGGWSDTWQVTVSQIDDKDNDGIDDGWEIFYFTNTKICDASSNQDGDGYSDLQEFLNQQSGEKDPLGNWYDPTVKNAPGGAGYDPRLLTRGYLPMIFPLLLDEKQ